MLNPSNEDDISPNPFRGSVQHRPLQQQQQAQDGFHGNTMSNTSSFGSSNNNQVDPHSGMTGSMDVPDSPPHPYGQGMQQQQQQQMHLSPSQWSGTMDQRAVPTEVYGDATNQTMGVNAQSNAPMGWRSCMSCFNMASYYQYFDMETPDIILRLKASLFKFLLPDQFRTAVVGDVRTDTLKGPDLYGPVWISFTLIFVVAVSSNIHAYWTHKRNERKADEGTEVGEFEADITRLLHASTIVLGFVFGVSTAFWLATNCIGMPGISWAMWVCCYGYSQVSFLPATLLIAVLPFELVSWVSLGCATGVSVLLILRNLSTPLMAQDSSSNAKAAPLILAILGSHVVYFFVVKFIFFP